MPWHDVHLTVQGKVVADMSHHFLEYWDHSYLEAIFIKKDNVISEVRKAKLNLVRNKKKNMKDQKILSTNKQEQYVLSIDNVRD